MSVRLLHYSDLENAYDDPERVGRLAGLIDSLRDDTTLVAGTGDNTGPGVLALTEDGEQSLDFFEAVEPAADIPGNHDFDHGYDALRGLVESSPQIWLGANIELDGERFGSDVGMRPWTVIERAGHRIGVIGVTTPTTPSITPPAADLTVTDPVSAVANATATLRERGVDMIVVLAHLADDEQIALQCDVDVILGGHVHAERIRRLDDTLLTRPRAGGNTLYEIVLEDDGTASVNRHTVDDAPVARQVTEALRVRKRRAGLQTVVATVERPIERTEATTHRGESRIGNFVADAYRWYTDADIALQNAGGIRGGEPLAGGVTVADLIGIVPFEEPIVTAELTGAEIVNLCREASGQRIDIGEPDWWHAHLSGAEVVWDRTDESLVDVHVGGEPVDSTGEYTLATSAYLPVTDHEFPTLSEGHVVSEGPIQYDVLVEYARDVGIDPSIDGRIRWSDDRSESSDADSSDTDIPAADK
ncbi:bifunctional metallophosphatase/5'-nucleotidase [Natranaeroarchaeum aerophilus]|uniref:5'-nucleotidase C-terminal domain-containing protein n=1 Tax=Natranaeroarchaeum aerophilus TaxID=2917711 RepID=A0AAE3FRK7_9EURY|nr:bifunctional metallophosphatase/5'-nucleotidase [Natranaeroarchaeum aerophilus]MCL9813800.1 5'-nucleotidase C-terminal domain-containing protein [Natranaeroarchaeum aerophilus]